MFRIDRKLDDILSRLDALETTGAIEPVFVEGGELDEVNNFFSLSLDIPVGKTLVVTHVGANILAREAPDDFRARIILFCTDTEIGVPRIMPLGVLQRGPNTAGGTTPNYFFGSPTKIFCTPEFRSGVASPGRISLSVSGDTWRRFAGSRSALESGH